jgi:multidrug efflux pump subunit AcrA (membrane-fusion protein)
MAMVSRPIFAIIDIDKVKVVADLPERYMGQVRNGAGTSIEVDAFPGRAFEGTVTRISPTVNVVNRTAELEIMVQNMDHLLKPGMFARIALNIARREGVPVILEAAVLREEAGEHVFVVEEVVRPRRVRLGRKKGSAVEVLDGVRAGEVLGVLKEEGIGEGAGREFPPEMFERFKVSTPEGGEAPLIPEAAVVRGRSGDYVFAFEGIAHRRKVTLGLEEGPRVEVSEGLEAGELLVVAGQQKLRDGQGVLILQ